jgi:hypothetical protein
MDANMNSQCSRVTRNTGSFLALVVIENEIHFQYGECKGSCEGGSITPSLDGTISWSSGGNAPAISSFPAA